MKILRWRIWMFHYRQDQRRNPDTGRRTIVGRKNTVGSICICSRLRAFVVPQRNNCNGSGTEISCVGRAFGAVTHLFVLVYEEPTLRSTTARSTMPIQPKCAAGCRA